MERWLPVPEFEGIYEVSDFGRFKSLPRKVRSRGGLERVAGGKILKIGYHPKSRAALVSLWKDGVGKSFWVAPLVLTVFRGPRPEGMEACHFPDRDPSNNHIDNLRWDTPVGNQADKIVHRTTNRGERNGMSKISDDQADVVVSMCAAGVKQRVVGNQFGISQQEVSKIWRKQRRAVKN